MFFSRMTVAARLYVGFGLIVALLVVVTGVAVVKVDRIERALRANSDIYSQVQRNAINFRGSAHDRSIAVRDLVFSPTPSERAKEIATIAALADFYAQSTQSLEALLKLPGVSPEVHPLYADIKRAESQAVTTTNTIIEQVREGNAAAVDTLWSQAKPQYVQWLASINRLIDFKEKHIQATNQSAMEEASGFLRVMFTALTLALILSAAVAWGVARSIVRQLGAEPNALAQVARQVAQGDLHPVAGVARAQSDSVLASLGAMQTSLAQVVDKVRDASNAVTQGADEIAAGNAGLLQRTEEQASNLQQASASMEEMTSSVKNNADTARQAAQLAASASEAAHKGGEVVTQVVHTMEDISASSYRIADIIGVIDSIAFQTNILALNAAVEAARAGEEGRGFAVVAGEVRALAQRSADAARQIKALIETSVAKVEQGTQLVNDAGATMTDIVAQAQRVAGLIAEISRATAEQTQGIAQVGGAVAHLDQATQQNAAMVEQSAAAAQALRHQAAQLGAAVRVFRLTGVDSAYESRHLPAHRLQGTAPALAPATLRNAAAARITKLHTTQT
ncbi:methyl-accepting chemotaxis protein [Comamonas jiangduensis]|uniref:methyl-accepting chemotaxis protein n=1 Tax=Comamonas jiangduensis TaxID=1194168 RepID=UPI0028B078C0|nr:methyl-accepting chemotaxis protein [Comamonas jiangduensis]